MEEGKTTNLETNISLGSIFNRGEDSEERMYALRRARELNSGGANIYSSLPIICKGELCPYAEACPLLDEGLNIEGESCALEIAAMEDLFVRYCSDLNINPSDPAQQVDSIMVKDLVDLDMSIIRCDKKIAISADYIIENVVGVTEDQTPIVQEAINPIVDAKEKFRTQKYKTLNLLNSTRKDKFGSAVSIEVNPLERASELVKSLDVIEAKGELEEQEEEYYRKLSSSVGDDIARFKGSDDDE